ncbi:MAG: hypothetical protein PUI85_00325 [Eubacteriales bacterium]|nr:hypothetical protein [Eubacteriales bacterium]MDY3333043.1 hypothetical protein [Gallibacter sp.]
MKQTEFYDGSKGKYKGTLEDIYNWQEEADWAYGKRYSAEMNKHQRVIFYIKDNKVESIMDNYGYELYRKK